MNLYKLPAITEETNTDFSNSVKDNAYQKTTK